MDVIVGSYTGCSAVTDVCMDVWMHPPYIHTGMYSAGVGTSRQPLSPRRGSCHSPSAFPSMCLGPCANAARVDHTFHDGKMHVLRNSRNFWHQHMYSSYAERACCIHIRACSEPKYGGVATQTASGGRHNKMCSKEPSTTRAPGTPIDEVQQHYCQ